MIHARGTSFATAKDMRNYIRCRDNGGSVRLCLNIGDNGEGKWGTETWNVHGVPMVALPEEEMRAKWGHVDQAKGKKVRIILGLGHGNPFEAEVQDAGPEDVIDLNPAALVAAGLEFDTELDCPARWEWI